MKRWEDMNDRGITVYALVMALIVSGMVLTRPVLGIIRNGFSWSPWLLAYALIAVALGALAFFVNRQGGRYMRRHRGRRPGR